MLQSSVYSGHQADLVVSVELLNQALLKEVATTGPSHTCMILIGDADNQVVCKQRVR